MKNRHSSPHLHHICTYVPRVPQCLSPRPNRDPSTPSNASECSLPRKQRRGGGHSRMRVRGCGGHNLESWIKILKLCICTTYCSDHLGRRDDASLNDVSRLWGADVMLRARVQFVHDALIWWSFWCPEAEFMNVQFR
jgi:hypothetical protein